MNYLKIIDLLFTLIVLLPIFCRGLPMLLDNKPFCQHKAFPIIPYRSQIWPNFRGTMCGTTRLSRHNWSPTYFTRLLARTVTADTRRGDPPGNLLNCHKDRLIDMRPSLLVLVCAYALWIPTINCPPCKPQDLLKQDQDDRLWVFAGFFGDDDW